MTILMLGAFTAFNARGIVVSEELISLARRMGL
jgi:hypothetical protein